MRRVAVAVPFAALALLLAWRRAGEHAPSGPVPAAARGSEARRAEPHRSPDRESSAAAGPRAEETLAAFNIRAQEERREIVAALDAEREPARRAALYDRLMEFDRRTELEALRLKREWAVARGDRERVEAIDRLLAEKAGR